VDVVCSFGSLRKASGTPAEVRRGNGIGRSALKNGTALKTVLRSTIVAG